MAHKVHANPKNVKQRKFWWSSLDHFPIPFWLAHLHYPGVMKLVSTVTRILRRAKGNLSYIFRKFNHNIMQLSNKKTAFRPKLTIV